MGATIFTIGFAGKTAEEFFKLLSEANVQKLVDVRENRLGQLSGFAKYPDLEFFLGRISGIAYIYEPRLAPTPEIRKAYRANKDWSAYELSFLQLMRDRQVPQFLEHLRLDGGNVVLLCSEPAPDKCHRRLVAQLLAENLEAHGRAVTIQHLVIEKLNRRTRKKTDPV